MQSNEPEFRAWRRRVLNRWAILCALAMPVGLCFIGRSPWVALFVSGLGLIGLIVSLVKIERFK